MVCVQAPRVGAGKTRKSEEFCFIRMAFFEGRREQRNQQVLAFPKHACRANAELNKQAFLEEGLVEEYAPHPLDFSTLFDFLKLFEEEDGTGKTGPLDDGGKLPALLAGAMYVQA